MLNACRYQFPDPSLADPAGEGLIAFGGDLAADTLLCAYRQGIFPWFNEGEPIAWWSPDPRCVIYPNQFVPSKTLKRTVKSKNWFMTINQNFADVIQACSETRAYADGTWINPDMILAYTILNQLGFAYSVEIWDDNPGKNLAANLIGGLYGLKIGQAFFGESMFHRVTDASKVAFFALMRLCELSQFEWVDCQLPNQHLMSLGATVMTRADFLAAVKHKVAEPSCDWTLLDKQPMLANQFLFNPTLFYHSHQLQWLL